MLQYVARRTGYSALVVFGVSILAFLSLHLAPGDPAALIAGPQAEERDLQAIRERYGLNDPLPVQYWNWLHNIARGDFGVSLRGGRPVWTDLARSFPISLSLAFGGLVVAVVLGIPSGVMAAVHRGSLVDLTVMSISVAGMSMPVFWVSLLLVLYFSLQLGWFPSSGWGSLRHYVLPVFSVSLTALALVARMTRAAMVEALLEDYVRTARAKGLLEQVVLYRHALRNALIPVVTVIGIRFGYLVGGAIVTETVFAIPGVGRLIVLAVNARDFPIVQGSVLLIAVAISVVNLFVDILYGVFDPRMRYGD